MTGWSDPVTVRFALAAIVAAAVGLGGWRRGALSADGAVAAWLVGVATVGFGGWWWGVVVVAFFLSSSVLAALPRPPGTPEAGPGTAGDRLPERSTAPSDRLDPVRTWEQVLANGGVPVAIAVLAGTGLTRLPDRMAHSIPSFVASLPESLLESLAGPGVAFVAFAGALAAATADTWATEVGRFSRKPPRLLTTARVVAPGTSGAVSPIGTLASATGTILIATFAAGVGAYDLIDFSGSAPRLWLALSAAGFVGSLADSLLGATIQATYICPECGHSTEARIHCARTPTHLVRGYHWLTNDVVNGLTTLVGAIVAACMVAIAG
ncbi:MAG: DUF92 domain-containing protein [Chloroflexota bacterium]|nr:DUF92 domain-containing protein [Chloroflexota bacterium]